MDFKKIAVACLACIALLHTAEAGCIADLADNDPYKECLSGFMGYISNAASGTNGGDGSEIIAVMCSPEGQAAMECVIDFIKKCPELKDEEGMETFKQMDNMGGLAGMCGIISGPCSAAEQCFSSADFEGAGDPSMTNPATVFNMYQEQMKVMCGPVKQQFDCLKDLEGKCPKLESQMTKMMEMGRSQATPGTAFPAYKEVKMFVMNECPKLPADFATNKCVKDNLMTKEFKDCYTNTTGNDASENAAELSCDAYKKAFSCVPKAIGDEECGQKYTDAFVKVTNMFLAATHNDNCKLESSYTASSNIVQMSSATILAALLTVFKLL